MKTKNIERTEIFTLVILDCKGSLQTSICMKIGLFLRRRQWHPTPVLLPGKSHGQGSLVGCSPWGCSRTRLSDFTFTFHFHALEKEMATHSSVLAWRIPRTGEPGGLPSMGSHRVGHDWSDLAAAAATFTENYFQATLHVLQALLDVISECLWGAGTSFHEQIVRVNKMPRIMQLGSYKFRMWTWAALDLVFHFLLCTQVMGFMAIRWDQQFTYETL